MISILTRPFPKIEKSHVKALKSLMGKGIKTEESGYGGHPAVTRSLCEGLKSLGTSFNYNPNERDIYEDVVVLYNIDALKQAISLKRSGRIKTLIAGPNLVILPTDYDSIITADEIDLCITPSQWVCDNYIFLKKELQNRCLPWPAGVDLTQWQVNANRSQNKRILLFNKRAPHKLFERCVEISTSLGYEVDVITYGSYTLDDYKERLAECSLLVHFVEQESQGISLLEAWAADIPTLVWNPGYFLWENKNFECSSSPYLTEQTGQFFYDDVDYYKVLSGISLPNHGFSPRLWVSENMTDTISAQKLLNLIYAQQNKTAV